MLNTHFANIVKSYIPMMERLTNCYVFYAPVEDAEGNFSVDIELTSGTNVRDIYNLSLAEQDGRPVIEVFTNGSLYGYRSNIMNDIIESMEDKLSPEKFSRKDYFERNGLDISNADDWDKIAGLSFTNEDNEKPRIYFDMDGTLAVFNKNATMEEVFSPGYFRGLEPIKETIELAEALVKDGYDVQILSGACYSAVQEKIEWLKEHMPFISPDKYNFVPVGADKSKFIPDPKHSILIDDYNKNLYEWEGLAVKCVTDINNPNKQFCNLSVLEDPCTHNMSVLIQALEDWMPKESINIRDFMALTYTADDKDARPRVICRDGFSFGVETGEGSYTEPAVQIYKYMDYRSIEITKPSVEDETLEGFAEEYLHLSGPITECEIPYVPVELIEEMIEKHGGIDEEMTFSKEDIERYNIAADYLEGKLDNIISDNGLNVIAGMTGTERNEMEEER